MQVGFDAHALGQQQTGNETYALGLLHGLAQIGFHVRAYSYVSPPTAGHYWRPLRRRSRWLRIAVDVPLAAARDGLHLYHGVWAVPPIMPCRTVVTVHDLTFAVHAGWLRRDRAAIMRRTVGHAVKRAVRVIAISEQTKADIVEWYGIPPERVCVTHLAPRPELLAEPDISRGKRDPYFLFVGNVVPRKNVGVLVQALALLRDRGTAVPLVIAGHPGPGQGDVLDRIRRLRLDGLVRFTGYLSNEALRSLYAGCTAVVHPALYEGFGLTPLEAMALGRPVLASDAGSLPEVVGDAGYLLPPSEPQAWAGAMEQVLCEVVNRQLVDRGLRRAAEFSWERCARQTVDVYRAAVES